VPYLFFVAHPDGHHEFRETFAEHSRAIREVRRQAAQR
jgi:cell division protein YceG involved in septum cleavage